MLPILAAMVLVGASVNAACITGGCHQKLSLPAYPHAPVADDCLSCHVAVTEAHPLAGQKTFKLVAEGAQLCFQCHDPFPQGKIVHAPVKDGECLSCHQVHGAANPKLLEVGADLTPLCFGCHDAEPFRREFSHGPAAAGACTSCHNPHVSNERALLKKPARAACLECHADFASQLQTAQVVHEPVKKSPCTDCHDPHAEANRYVLKQKMPDLCSSCHSKISDKMAKVKVRHAPMDDAGSCGNCHSSHFSQDRGLLPANEKTVCLNCHGTDNLGKPPLKNIRTQLLEKAAPRAGRVKKQDQEQKEKQYLHGPLQEGRCAGCHDPHGSDNFRILTGPYPADFYTPFQEGAYDFCLQCHDKYLLRFKDTSLYTSFRNGNRNLHFVHVNDKRKGRTCRICHEPHASNGQKLISEQGMPFGDWKIPIRFQATATGGSCAPGCHRPFKYDRDVPIDYRQESSQ
jgi:predicted CXXCH cytochrome family protein